MANSYMTSRIRDAMRFPTTEPQLLRLKLSTTAGLDKEHAKTIFEHSNVLFPFAVNGARLLTVYTVRKACMLYAEIE